LRQRDAPLRVEGGKPASSTLFSGREQIAQQGRNRRFLGN
jgi:hypothetical protein